MKYLQKFKIDLNDVDAFIFDTDGVITDTASVHAATWKQLLDEYLKKVADSRLNRVLYYCHLDTVV
jgi:beta-phosphoglucomutase-like phosphatase (HAD superfamily)